MKALIAVFTVAMLTVNGSQAQKIWTEADPNYTVDNLKRTRDELIRETENLSDAQWHFHEAPDRWSIAEVVEHLALWEIIWAREISMGNRSTPRPDLIATSSPDSYYHDFIMENKAHVSPDFSRPTGFIQGKNNLIFFTRLRNQAIGFADTTQADMRVQFELTATKYPRNMHQVYIYQWGHVDRHMRQIRKIKAHPNYPKETATN
ncbi:DinB family protein [Spirosoma endophyticum]|uniref:DinB superfamily protein n=1 Tax=Spirosoma endophyticum TaxID=662367 RepID=A0A1I2EM43_9BACT|nr:DinB family protein [Spirosoma endophyticum]SFE93677.1 DinB superfamily protein [Spirosoma endophyticum]